jgi:hypothetical protein
MTTTSPAEDTPFENWFNTKGLRTFSKNHGNAIGHKEYMNEAFNAGYNAALDDILNKNKDLDSLVSEFYV